MGAENPEFVIITPAHNEADLIENTIHSMIGQSLRPRKWIIVNDASTDQTGPVIERYASQHDFILPIQYQRPIGRHFANKVRAFNRGLSETSSISFDLVGNLDADISLDRDYFAKIIEEFKRDPRLGIGGGMVHTRVDGRFQSQNVSLDSVAGAVQLFRRQCFEQIGGYVPLPSGGIDAAAEITARMKGWRVKTFAELAVFEHRRTGTAAAGPIKARLNEGRRLHLLGYSFSFFAMRCCYRALERPTVVGSAAAMAGFLLSAVRGNRSVLPPEVVRYLRSEQRKKLVRCLKPSPSV